jgi:hypothetical protein
MTMKVDEKFLSSLYNHLTPDTKEMVDRAVKSIVAAKNRGGKVVVVTGSGPNLHEGVTTLIAELMNKGIVDGVTTSSAVVAHEMAGVLEEVKRVDGKNLGFTDIILPRGDTFELSLLPEGWLQRLQQEMILDFELMEKIKALSGSVIIKAAGNMAYPLGLWTENLAKEILMIARSNGLAFETVAGAGADPRTMLGAAYAAGKPLLVTVPQLIGGGWVGMAIGDSISISERCNKIARMMQEADVIIESAVVLTQEIHDGPFETYTGHGIWSQWEGYPTYRLKEKTLVRIDLDPNLKAAWEFEHQSGEVQKAIDQGMPKTKLMKIPFRMEMSGFCRLENSIPVIGDIGAIWPAMALHITHQLGVQLDFMSYPQQTPLGQEMRKWIVDNIQPVDKKKLHQHSRK